MKLTLELWTKDDYQEYVKYLISLKDEKNKIFSERIIFTKNEILGIKLPILRDIAKQISKGDYKSFLKYNKYKYHEEILIYLFVVAYSKNLDILKDCLDECDKYIDNWSSCDSLTSSLKHIKNNDEFFNKFKEFACSNSEYKVRVGVTGILFNYVDDNHIDEILKTIDKVSLDTYYVNMAVAWLLNVCFIKERTKTLEYLKHTKINNFTFNKFISKCRDSFRVSQSDKDFLKTLKK